MEKIYMEENNNKKGRKSVVDTSVVLSFVVAIFAIFSLAMAGLSMNQKSGVSYAAPTALPDNFTFHLSSDNVVAKTEAGGFFNVPLYYASSDTSNPVFCVEHTAPVDDGINYTSGDVITDYGLLYLLNHSYANGVSIVNANSPEILGSTAEAKAANAKYANAWITQVAIWMYLYDTDPEAGQTTSKNHMTDAELSAIQNSTLLAVTHDDSTPAVNIYTGSEPIYTKYVLPLVKDAKAATDVATLTVSKTDDKFTLKDDYYESSLISVVGSPSSALLNYTLSVNGIEGVKIVAENGTEITGEVAAGTKFYLKVPKEKVTTETQTLTITANGKFTTLEGKYYVGAGDHQKVVSVKTSEKTISNGTSIEIVGPEDTGMNKVQTIYFIGLIVLLCGIGIVYANAKPVQVKQ